LNGNNDFRHSRHTDGIGTQCTIHTNFRRSFIAGASHTQVYSLSNWNPKMPGDIQGNFPHAGIVCIAHIRKTGARFIEIWPTQRIGRYQRIGSHHINMIVNQHQVARPEFRIQSARRIGHDQTTNSQTAQNPYRKRDFLHRIPFVEMDAALKSNTGYSLDGTKDKVALMTCNSGIGKMRNFSEGKDFIV
jgi:hypothetical protein